MRQLPYIFFRRLMLENFIFIPEIPRLRSAGKQPTHKRLGIIIVIYRRFASFRCGDNVVKHHHLSFLLNDNS